MDKISIYQIKKFSDLLIIMLKSLDINEIELYSNWYWKVDDNEIFDFNNVPTELNVASFSDEIERFKTIIETETFLVSDIECFSNIIKCIHLSLTKK